MIPAPCIGRCEQAPAAVVRPEPGALRHREKVASRGAREGATDARAGGYIGLSQYRAAGGYALLEQCLAGKRDVESVIKAMEASGLRGLGGAGFPAGPQVAHRARRSPRRA